MKNIKMEKKELDRLSVIVGMLMIIIPYLGIKLLIMIGTL